MISRLAQAVETGSEDRHQGLLIKIEPEDRPQGLLIGMAVGGALGLPAEGLSARRPLKRFKGCWHHRFLFRRGMVSDDTGHTIFVAQCLLSAPDSPSAFGRALAGKLRWWLLCLPANIGLATLRGIIKLWLGVPPQRSGVYSAGNGPRHSFISPAI